MMAATAEKTKPKATRRRASGPGIHGSPPRPGLRTPAFPGTDLIGGAAALAQRTLKRTVGRLTVPIREVSLDERDPDELRETLAVMWLISSLWFRSEVRGMGNVPDEGPALLVGNHSGGNMTPDTFALALAFSTYFGVERRLHLLAANPVFALPGVSHLRKAGVVSATESHARQALAEGGVACVYPGGHAEAHRPSWRGARIEVGDLSAQVRLAAAQSAPLIPVVAIGGQQTALFLSSGEQISAALGLAKLGIPRVPISIAAPWGLNVGDLFGHLPLPSKLTLEVLPPIDVRARLKAGTSVEELAEHVASRMQDTLDALAQERRLPVIG